MKPANITSAQRDAEVLSLDVIEDAAANWLVRRHAGFAAGEEAQFHAWLSADPRHSAVFASLENAWDALNRPRKAGRADAARRELRARAQRRARRRATWALGTAGLAAAAALIVAFLPAIIPSAVPEASPPTAVLRPNLQTLADGSTVELDAGAEVAVEFSAEKRGVRLVRGEALFSVAKDAARPFVVTVAGIEVRAVGTAFFVRYAPQQVDVLVTEGRVAVERVAGPQGIAALPDSGPESSDAVTIVTAGELTSVPLAPDSAPLPSKPLAPAEIAAALAWRGKRVEFTGTPLSAAAELFNRQNRIQLSIADSPTGRLQITGIVWIDDPEGFARLIETGLNLHAQRSGDSIVLRQIPSSPTSN